MGVEEPGAYVEGKTIAEWTGDWWNWALSFEDELSPVSDTTGAQCGNGQKGNVWFLAGSYGSDAIHRECTIPTGKYLLIPMVNDYYYADTDESYSCAELNSDAEFSTKKVSVLIDGMSLKNANTHYEQTKECFKLKMYDEVFNASAAGYWVMINPLTSGNHTLRVQSKEWGYQQDITYQLTVSE